VLDDFPEGLETGEITKALCSVGFASPPDWLKSYDCLSQGEKMRVDIAVRFVWIGLLLFLTSSQA